MSYYLQCAQCNDRPQHIAKQTVCTKCGGILFVHYHDDINLETNWIDVSNPTMWRYSALLPPDPQFRITLGEGFTPILDVKGYPNLLLKDEGKNPTGTFKARGIAMSISMAKQFGINHVALATAGNAGGATALYASVAGMKATIAMPTSAPEINRDEVLIANGDLKMVDGNIANAGAYLEQYLKEHPEVFSLSTMKEPYRVEGKKTMGFEIWEQLGQLPENIIYPTGGGTGIVGIWKAFKELQQFGLLETISTKMFTVQSTGCAPIVEAFNANKDISTPWKDPYTFATGLCVPKAYGDYLVLKAIHESYGSAISVTDEQIYDAMRELGKQGLVCAPEGAATLAAYKALLEKELISAEDTTLLLMTGSGYKYISDFKL